MIEYFFKEKKNKIKKLKIEIFNSHNLLVYHQIVFLQRQYESLRQFI